jgi:hypothetical protein
LVLGLITPAALEAAPKVLGQRSYWDGSRRYIWSDLDLIHDDGRLEVKRVPGGSVDGIAMRQFYQWGQGGPPAVFYVPQVTTQSKKRMRWQSGCVYITPDAKGSEDVPGDDEYWVVKRVVEHWEASTAACGYLRFRRNAPRLGEVGFDAVNRILYIEDVWCPPGVSAGSSDCYPEEATAITTIFHVDNPARSDDGDIIDADIELNSVHYAMASRCETTCQTDGDGDVEDLENTLTHEIGHVIGLDHPCWSPRRDGQGNPIGDQPRDGNGNLVPLCDPESELPSEILEATMFARQAPREIKKRTLEPDDIEGFCDLYPIADDPENCNAVGLDGGGCEIVEVDGGPPWMGWLVILGLVGFTARACSRSRRP